MKRIVASLMAVVIALGMSPMTAHALNTSGAKITGMAQSLSVGYSSGDGSDAVDLGEINPNDERVEYIYLYDSMFTWDDGTAPEVPELLSTAQIRNGKLTVRTSSSQVLDSVSIDNQKSRIEIEFLDELISTEEKDFNFDIYLYIDGRRQSQYSMTFTGTFANEVIELDSDSETIDISDGAVIEALENIPKIEIELGNGVFLITKLFEDNKVYGTTTRTPDGEDTGLMAVNPGIEVVIALKTVGIKSSGNIVKLDSEYSQYHVYNKELSYVGTAGEMLPYSDKYYLSNEKWDVTVADGLGGSIREAEGFTPVETGGTDPGMNNNSDTGGDSIGNDNPGTGRPE